MHPILYQTSSLTDLNKFNISCGYDLTIIPMGDTSFYSDIKILTLDSDTNFSIITNTAQEIILNNNIDFYSLFLTYSPCEYINGDRSYSIESGQLGLIDLSESLSLTYGQLRIVKSLKISKKKIDLERFKIDNIMTSKYSSLIIHILSSMTIDDSLIINKKDTIINLLNFD
ncbi:hypothetical protein C0W59_21590 [Photobacterium kishitanii]|uniref:hypothetical protein n=1 Tax=Photobacterium kishitanii TaxID=318456 RepID=UPI000D16DF01|nr:hypothetical protein [Photobacterium kishitanii]PSV10003.1 hypothetical protein C0W59_21590 [Photobacterium kishitanii]